MEGLRDFIEEFENELMDSRKSTFVDTDRTKVWNDNQKALDAAMYMQYLDPVAVQLLAFTDYKGIKMKKPAHNSMLSSLSSLSHNQTSNSSVQFEYQDENEPIPTFGNEISFDSSSRHVSKRPGTESDDNQILFKRTDDSLWKSTKL